MSDRITALINLVLAVILAAVVATGFMMLSTLSPLHNSDAIPQAPEILRVSPNYPDPAFGTHISERLKQDLLTRQDLIPFDGVLGGTMGFHTTDNMYLLSERWVFAQFDDGHIAGSMLLEYKVREDGSVAWEVLEAYLD